MIQLYTWPTPNGYKISILLEELEMPYEVIPVDIWKGDQFKPEFLKISPNNKIPAIIDPDGPEQKPYSLFESGAIMMYLAARLGANAGKFLPKNLVQHFDCLQWLMFQMAGVGPMLGQTHHFRIYAPEKIDYAIKRYTNEATRLYNVIEKRLGESKYLGGDSYTIADMAVFPWLRNWEKQGQDLKNTPKIAKWLAKIEERPAVIRGLALLQEHQVTNRTIDDKSREIMFGKK